MTEKKILGMDPFPSNLGEGVKSICSESQKFLFQGGGGSVLLEEVNFIEGSQKFEGKFKIT